MQHSHPPTHDEIAQQAKSIWTLRGKPSGLDAAIWLEAEQQLSIDEAGPKGPGSVAPTASPGPMGRVLSSPQGGRTLPHVETSPIHAPATSATDPDVVTAKAVLVKKSARAPRLPTHKNAPHAAPTESGKPLWNQPHSS